MADAVPLDPGPYAGTYKLIGGSPALDFANLVSYRDTPRAHDWLVPAGNLRRWVRAAGLDVPADADWEDLVALREALAAVFLDVVDGVDPRGPALDLIAETARLARARQRLDWDTGGRRGVWRLSRPSLSDLLALDAARLLTDDAQRDRVGACVECRWVYLDATRNRSRRWCDPADCGNRARQRRHYQRGRAT
ncbi:MAG TPA: ABATE domain-containing protein [Euzebyales bacterium]|nr:ABATE domain-containing protein [Euzebyales bacterium]